MSQLAAALRQADITAIPAMFEEEHEEEHDGKHDEEHDHDEEEDYEEAEAEAVAGAETSRRSVGLSSLACK